MNNNDTPSAFSVSHYVLLFIVSTLCTVSVVWVLIAANNRESAINDKIMAPQNAAEKSCQRTAADEVHLLWEQKPQDIPQKYITLEKNYANRIVAVRTTGTCNGQRFVCKMGQHRQDCDPCAKKSAHKRAMFQHISDTIDEVCKND